MNRKIEKTSFLTFLPKSFIVYLFSIFIFINSPLAHAKEFACQLNKTNDRQNSKKDRLFLFNSESYKKGSFKVNYKENTLLMWSRGELIHLLLGSSKKKVSIKTSFLLIRDKFSLTLNPLVKLKCVSRKGLPKKENNNQKGPITIPSTGSNLIVEIQKDLLFKYYTKDSIKLVVSYDYFILKKYNYSFHY